MFCFSEEEDNVVVCEGTEDEEEEESEEEQDEEEVEQSKSERSKPKIYGSILDRDRDPRPRNWFGSATRSLWN